MPNADSPRRRRGLSYERGPQSGKTVAFTKRPPKRYNKTEMFAGINLKQVQTVCSERAVIRMDHFWLDVNFRKPAASADLKGSALAPGLVGRVEFYHAPGGSVVRADVCGLPAYRQAQNGEQPVGPFGFHIREGPTCGLGDGKDAFRNAEGHYNPYKQPHGNEAGDLPVLFSNNGCAHVAFYTNKFKPADVVGRTVIIHLNPDDFRTQPAGNSGPRIACGVIVRA